MKYFASLLLVGILLATSDCWKGFQCSVDEVLWTIFGAFVSLMLFIAGIFFTAMDGKRQIKSWLFVRKIRRKIDPLATSVGATVSTNWKESPTWHLYYTFQDGNFITLSGSEHGFNVFTPNWKQGFEKETPQFEVLMNAIARSRK